MADQKSEKSKTSTGCPGNMKEMMQKMMPNKGGACCPCAETMTEAMEGCCPAGNQEENPGKPGPDAPR